MLRLKTQVRIVAAVAVAGLLTGLALLLRAEAGPMLAVLRGTAELESIARLDELVHALQTERGLTQALLGGLVGPERLTAQHARTDAALGQAGAGAPAEPQRQALAVHRAQVLAGRIEPQRSHADYGALIAPLLRHSTELVRDHDMDALRAPLSAHASLAQAKELLGQLRALGLRLATIADDPDARLLALQQLAAFEAVAGLALEASDDAQAAVLRDLRDAQAMRALRAQAQALARTGQWDGPARDRARAWFTHATALMDALHQQQQDAVQRMQAIAREELEAAALGLAGRSALVVLAWLASCWLVYAALRRLLATIRRLDAEARALFGHLPQGDAQATRPGESESGFMQLVERVDELGRQARTDALTGVLNRHGLQQRFGIERSRSQRHGRPIGVIVADIDHFKQVNDLHGHTSGDVALQRFAQLLRRNVRADDIVARWGGEEFVVIATECDEDGAAALAEKLRNAVVAHDFALRMRLSASFGVAGLAEGETLDAAFARADAALYRAKADGRNRVYRAAQAGGCTSLPSQPTPETETQAAA